MINVNRTCPVLIKRSIEITVLILQFIYLHGLAPISFLFLKKLKINMNYRSVKIEVNKINSIYILNKKLLHDARIIRQINSKQMLYLIMKIR